MTEVGKKRVFRLTRRSNGEEVEQEVRYRITQGVKKVAIGNES